MMPNAQSVEVKDGECVPEWKVNPTTDFKLQNKDGAMLWCYMPDTIKHWQVVGTHFGRLIANGTTAYRICADDEYEQGSGNKYLHAVCHKGILDISRKCTKMPPALISLIKHNFYANLVDKDSLLKLSTSSLSSSAVSTTCCAVTLIYMRKKITK
ncbi:hypothetical protein MHBO_005171, partial [Bonamia ostreae]